MSSKKKGIARKNISQQRSTETKDQLKKGINRVDKGAQSKGEEKPTKSVKRFDKNATVKEEAPKKIIKRTDKNQTSSGSETITTKNRRDPNAQIANKPERIVKRTNAMQTTSVKEQPQSQGIKRFDRNKVEKQVESKPKIKKKDPNATVKPEKKAKGVSRSGAANQQSTSEAPVTNRKKATSANSAFSQSKKEEPKPKQVKRTGKMNQTSESLGMEKNVKSSSRKAPNKGAAPHTVSNDIFGSKGKTTSKPPTKAKTINHMESSFTFG